MHCREPKFGSEQCIADNQHARWPRQFILGNEIARLYTNSAYRYRVKKALPSHTWLIFIMNGVLVHGLVCGRHSRSLPARNRANSKSDSVVIACTSITYFIIMFILVKSKRVRAYLLPSVHIILHGLSRSCVEIMSAWL
jgi:hypothetical protein